jgi:hypothetical protein
MEENWQASAESGPAGRKRKAGEGAGAPGPAKAAKAGAQQWVSWKDLHGNVFLAEKPEQVKENPARAEGNAESDEEDDVMIVKVTSVNGADPQFAWPSMDSFDVSNNCNVQIPLPP